MTDSVINVDNIIKDPVSLKEWIEKTNFITFDKINLVDHLNEITASLVFLANEVVKLSQTDEAEASSGIRNLSDEDKSKFYANLKLKLAIKLASDLQNLIGIEDKIVNSLVVRISGLK